MSKAFVVDLAERIASTFLVTFLGLLVSSDWFDLAHITQVSIVEKAALAGVAAVLSLIKGLVAGAISLPTSASLAARFVKHR